MEYKMFEAPLLEFRRFCQRWMYPSEQGQLSVAEAFGDTLADAWEVRVGAFEYQPQHTERIEAQVVCRGSVKNSPFIKKLQ